MSASVLICLYLFFRRYIRNYKARRRQRHNDRYDVLIGNVLNNPADAGALKALQKYRGRRSALTRSMLNYFRTVRGAQADALRDLASGAHFERRIIAATTYGSRGHRMRAVQILSYLDTQSSLQCIRQHLNSKDQYERLTAARAITRRGALGEFNNVVAAVSEAFPTKVDLLAEVLERFGLQAQPGLEDVVRSSNQKMVVASCLEALAKLSPSRTALDLSMLMSDEDSRVRSAAVYLSSVCRDASGVDLLLMGLKDDAIKVKIRAAKIACEMSRPDTAPHLYALTKDSSFWVRYWAMRAIWQLGKTGQQMVDALAASSEQGRDMAADVAYEMRAAHV